mgnify:CR=1 FL=1
MSNTPLDRIAGNDQSYLIAANADVTLYNFGSIVAMEDDTDVSVLEESTIDRDEDSPTYGERVAVDVTGEQNLSDLIKKGAILTPRRGYFTRVQADKTMIGYILLGPQAKMDQ